MNRIRNNSELCVYFIVCSVFLFFFLTHKYKKKHLWGDSRPHNTQTHNSLNTQFDKSDVAGWQSYVYELCSIRDCLGLLRLYDSTHPVFVALDKVAPRMSEADEAFVRGVIVRYGMEVQA